MQHLSGINIRKGLELEIPVTEILKLDFSVVGDDRVKKFHDNNENGEKTDADFLDDLKSNEVLQFREFLTSADINQSLSVFVFKNFVSTYTKFSKRKFECVSYPELIFLNNKVLSFEDLCVNFMSAQAFSGNFPQQENQHLFLGICDCEAIDVMPMLPLMCSGNCSVEYIFLYYNKIYSNLQNIMGGLLEDDINGQKEYISDEEYKKMIIDLQKYQSELDTVYKKHGII